MSVSVSVDSPRKLTKETLILLGGGAISGLVASGLHLIAGTTNPALSALAFGGVIGLMVNFADPRDGAPTLRLVLAVLAGIAMAILLSVHWAAAAAVGGLLFGAAFSLDNTGAEKAFFGVLFALAMTGGLYVSNVLGAFIDVAFVQNVFAASTWGLFLAFASGLKRVQWSRDEVRAEFADAYAELNGAERETIHNGRVLYDQILRELERTNDKSQAERAIEIATETSRALIAITQRSQQLREGAAKTSQRGLQSRIVALDERIQNAKDKTVRKELEATLEQLVEQVKVRKRFDVARARLEARQQRCFTALERLHVALVQSGTGADDAAVLDSIESLEKLSDEIRWRNLSVDELVGDSDEVPNEDTETDDIVAELRAELESSSEGEHDDEGDVELEASLDESDEVVLDEPQGRTVLDTGASSTDGTADEPPGTDGSVEVAAEPAHATSDSR